MATARLTGGLTPEEQAITHPFLAVVVSLHRELDARMRQVSGYSMVDYQLLLALVNAPADGLPMGSVAELLVITPSHLSRAASRLEADNAIVREPDPTNKRLVRVRLTPTGRHLLEVAAPAYAALVRDLLLTPLSAEQGSQLAGISATLLQHMADEASCAPNQSRGPSPVIRSTDGQQKEA